MLYLPITEARIVSFSNKPIVTDKGTMFWVEKFFEAQSTDEKGKNYLIYFKPGNTERPFLVLSENFVDVTEETEVIFQETIASKFAKKHMGNTSVVLLQEY